LHTNIPVQNFKEARLKFTCGDNIKQDLKTIGCQNIEWVQLAGLVIALNVQVPYKLVTQLVRAETFGLCRRHMVTFKQVRTWDSILN